VVLDIFQKSSKMVVCVFLKDKKVSNVWNNYDYHSINAELNLLHH